MFLRSFSATVIPSVTVPLALVGTLALMYVAGFSLDNLSLMGLTIAVGFVVDDAIVMLENIQRHIEEGLSPYQAARQGCRRNRLHHHVDQPVADRGVHSPAADGRDRRPHLSRIRRHRHDDDRRLGLRGADAYAGHGRALPAAKKPSVRTMDGFISRIGANVCDLMLAGYRRSLDVALRYTLDYAWCVLC